MTLKPLLDAGVVVQAHVLLAAAAVALAAAVLLRRKGTASHRALGRLWVGVMALVAGGSFLIRDDGPWLGLSWIHGLSAFTLAMLVWGVVSIRRGDRRRHATTMVCLVIFALGVTGAFTLLPGRIMHAVVFGGAG